MEKWFAVMGHIAQLVAAKIPNDLPVTTGVTMKYLFLVLLLVSCGEARQPGCETDTEVMPVQEQAFCFEAQRCYDGKQTNLNSYMCVCDKLCMCFYAVQEDCESIKDKTCKKSSVMALMASDFCLTEGKGEVLEEMTRMIRK